MAREIREITNTEEKAFKGDENAGKKGVDDQGSSDQPSADTQPPAEQEKPRDKAAVLKEMKARLNGLKDDDARLEKEEDSTGVLDGKVSTARHARRAAMRDLERDIASIEKGK